MRTTILWGGRIDDVSRRVLTGALRTAADEAHPVRIHAFSAAARDLFRHTLRSLPAYDKGGPRAEYFAPAARHRLPESCITESGPPKEELRAVIADLRRYTRLQPCGTLVEGSGAGGYVKEALPAILGMFDSMTDFLEQALQPLTRHIGRYAVRAFTLETRAELEELAARRMDYRMYTENLIVTQMSPRCVCVELEACLGAAAFPLSAHNTRL